MKNLFLNGCAYCTFLIAMGWSANVRAQEDLGPLRTERTEHMEAQDADSKPTLTRTSITPSRETARDSMSVKPASPRKPDTKNENAQDDILSFNFLYYIIQRFKLSDIVD